MIKPFSSSRSNSGNAGGGKVLGDHHLVTAQRFSANAQQARSLQLLQKQSLAIFKALKMLPVVSPISNLAHTGNWRPLLSQCTLETGLETCALKVWQVKMGSAIPPHRSCFLWRKSVSSSSRRPGLFSVAARCESILQAGYSNKVWGEPGVICVLLLHSTSWHLFTTQKWRFCVAILLLSLNREANTYTPSNISPESRQKSYWDLFMTLPCGFVSI